MQKLPDGWNFRLERCRLETGCGLLDGWVVRDLQPTVSIVSQVALLQLRRETKT